MANRLFAFLGSVIQLIILPALICMANSFLAGQVLAEAQTLDASVESVVTKLVDYLESKGEDSISIGAFHGPPQIGTTSGPAITQAFHRHFEKNKVRVRKRANIGLKGEFAPVKVTSRSFGIRITVALVDSFGGTLVDFKLDIEPGTVEVTVDDLDDVTTLLGTTVDLHPEDLPEDKARDVQKSVLDPSFHANGSRCQSSRGSPYSLEILVGGAGLPLENDEGVAFVSLEEGDTYTLKAYNESDYDAAVRLSVDGLSVFTFSDIKTGDGNPRYQFYIVPAQSAIIVHGWHRNHSSVDSFLITDYAKGAAASLNSDQDVGTISAQFSAAWPKGEIPPSDESASSKGISTGFGSKIAQETEEVVRHVGHLRSVVSIRYTK